MILFYNRALEIIQDEEYLDESDFDEIKRQKRQINPWTPVALIDNVVSLINLVGINVTEVAANDTFAETIAEVFEAIEEAAPAVAAVGGSVAAAAMFAMPSLPMTLASGVPPGTQPYFLKLLNIFLCFTLFH